VVAVIVVAIWLAHRHLTRLDEPTPGKPTEVEPAHSS
jgi:hypothetical protein